MVRMGIIEKITNFMKIKKKINAGIISIIIALLLIIYAMTNFFLH